MRLGADAVGCRPQLCALGGGAACVMLGLDPGAAAVCALELGAGAVTGCCCFVVGCCCCVASIERGACARFGVWVLVPLPTNLFCYLGLGLA